MGANCRNLVFAKFLKKNFRPTSILDVAAGDGRLSVCLSTHFPEADITAIDLKPRGNRRRLRFLKGRFPDRVKINEYDLIVGMHPDGATWPIVEECCKYRVAFAVVPCCLLHVPSSFPGGDMLQWVKYIEHYARCRNMRVSRAMLHMRGANRVVTGIPL